MNGTDIRILLVDDFELVRQLIKGILSEKGFTTVDEAENGKEAVSKIEAAQNSSQPYHIIFCDWAMPEMSGLEVLEHIRAKAEFKEVPFIMVTAESERANVVKAIRAGATDYMKKPIEPAALEKKVQKLVEKLRGQAA